MIYEITNYYLSVDLNLEFLFIKQKLSKVISQDSSGSGLRMRMLGMDVPGSNSSKLFDIFVYLFYLTVTALLEYLSPVDYMLVWFLLYNFVTVTLLLFKLSKGTVMMISLFTHQFQGILL